MVTGEGHELIRIPSVFPEGNAGTVRAQPWAAPGTVLLTWEGLGDAHPVSVFSQSVSHVLFEPRYLGRNFTSWPQIHVSSLFG